MVTIFMNGGSLFYGRQMIHPRSRLPARLMFSVLVSPTRRFSVKWLLLIDVGVDDDLLVEAIFLGTSQMFEIQIFHGKKGDWCPLRNE